MKLPVEARPQPPDFRHQVPPILRNCERSPADEALLKAYRSFYGLQLAAEMATHQFHHHGASSQELVWQEFRPKASPNSQASGGTTLLLHGYLDHVGTWAPFIEHLLGKGQAVLAFDLPGHGLSGGEVAAIDSFGEYTSALERILHWAHKEMPHPIHLVAHSTGCAIALSYLSGATERSFERVVFLAPLIRHVHWHFAKLGLPFAKLLKTLPRRYSDITSDAAYLRFQLVDPLQTRRVPSRWAVAMHRWEKEIQAMPPLHEEVLILQGTRDDVVWAHYNIGFLRRKLPRAQFILLKGGKHQLIRESAPVRERVYAHICRHLGHSNC